MSDLKRPFDGIPNLTILENEPMSAHSTMRVGGKAAAALFPGDADALVSAVRAAKKAQIKYAVIGNASNVIFPDDGYDGAVIFTKNLKQISFSDSNVTAECGVNIIYLASLCAEKGLSGLEFASGIPASVGGAVYMNAGAYGKSVSDVVFASTVYVPTSDTVKNIAVNEHGFGFRSSFFKNSDAILLSSSFSLTPCGADETKRTMAALKQKRQSSQPLEFPSAGSVFLPSNGRAAWEYVDGVGLRGYSMGGAQISEKHAGFIINRGGATAKDISELVEKVKSSVFEKYGVALQTEIIFIK